MPVNTDTGPRERLLGAAEQLLLTSEYDQVSVRAICAEAGANPAAVHYHFGTKTALVTALLEDRLAPIWASTLDHLAEAESTVASYLDAILEPFADLAAEPSGRLYLRLLSRVVLGRLRVQWSSRWFRLDSWADVLREECPGLTEQEAQRRWALAFELVLQQFGDPTADRAPTPAAVRTLRAFVLAGLTTAYEDTP